MSMLRFFVIAVGLVSHLPVGAQAPAAQSAGAGADFSGVYAAASFVAVATVVEPDVYPFTADAERAFNAYDPLSAAANQTDDCTVETMPGILWSNNPIEEPRRFNADLKADFIARGGLGALIGAVVGALIGGTPGIMSGSTPVTSVGAHVGSILGAATGAYIGGRGLRSNPEPIGRIKKRVLR